MKKFGSIFEEVMFDRKIEEGDKGGSLNVYYSIDIRITRGAEEEEANVKGATSYVQRAQGEVTVPESTVENIQNLHNLIDYMTGLVENGKPLIDEMVSEILKVASDSGSDSLQDLVQKEDKIIVDLSYGFDKFDGVGIKFNKTSGSDLSVFSMKKDNNIIPGTFNSGIFEQQILAVRKRFMEKE